MSFIKDIQEYFQIQANAIISTKESIDSKSNSFILRILNINSSNLFFSGVGKSGLISQVVSSSMTSLGFPSHFIHPTELMHGDLGHIKNGDTIIFITKSGESEELYNTIPFLKRLGAYIVLVTLNRMTNMAQLVDLLIILDTPKESLLDGRAPSTSNIIVLTYFYSLLSVLISLKNFSIRDFSNIHPAGLIGKKLNLRVRDILHKGNNECVNVDSLLPEILVKLSSSGCGGISVLNNDKQLVGVITDGDLRRLIYNKGTDDLFAMRPKQIMTDNPFSVEADDLIFDVFNDMKIKNISFVPIVDKNKIFLSSLGIRSFHDEGFHD